MLVLTRMVDEVIMIGDDISIMVVDINAKTGKVRLGIAAPREIPVHRMEVYNDLHANDAENQENPS